MTTDCRLNEQAVFPLNTVLFPGSILPLKIFEQRYLDLIKSCMKNDHGFVVAHIRNGNEVGNLPEIYSTGTYAEIIDWEQLDNTLLGITIKGIRRVNVLSTSASDNGMMKAKTENYEKGAQQEINLSNIHDSLIATLHELSNHPYVSERYTSIDYSSPEEIVYRLGEFLPVSNTVKQDLLETHDIYSQIEKLTLIINKLGG